VILLVAGHVVGMCHAPGGVHFSRAWVDKLRSRLVHGVPGFPKLLPLQPVRVFGWGPDEFRAPQGLQMLSLMFRCATCGFAAPGVLTGSG
jgi:hypothetical protein